MDRAFCGRTPRARRSSAPPTPANARGAGSRRRNRRPPRSCGWRKRCRRRAKRGSSGCAVSGPDFGRALTCACSRAVLTDGAPAVLVIASEAAGPPSTLRERVRRLFADWEKPLAVFAADGALLHATAAAAQRLAGADKLSALGVEATATQALAAGSASGDSRYGPITLRASRQGCVDRLGVDLRFGAGRGCGRRRERGGRKRIRARRCRRNAAGAARRRRSAIAAANARAAGTR